MPNWCYNYVTFMGSQKKLQRVADIINDADVKYFYRGLIGVHPNYSEDSWYRENLEWIGSKWDIPTDELDMPTTIDEHSDINIAFNSAWSPTIEGTKKVCEEFGISAVHEFYEEGNSFCGYISINEHGEEIESVEDSNYDRGLYEIWDYTKWYDWWFIPTIEGWDYSDKENSIEEFIESECSYLSESDMESALDDCRKYKAYNTRENLVDRLRYLLSDEFNASIMQISTADIPTLEKMIENAKDYYRAENCQEFLIGYYRNFYHEDSEISEEDRELIEKELSE